MPNLEAGRSKLCVVTEVFLSGLSPEHPIELPEEGGGQPPEGAHPSHPIYFPNPHPDHTLPGDLPHPDHELPGDQPKPDHTLPGDLPHAEHPIVIPPGDQLPPDLDPGLEVHVGWTEETGWVVVLVPTGTHVTPSAA